MRVKLGLENNYEKFDKMIPRKANILDLGCGYGFMSYMLHFLSEERTITGVDYDQDKIDTANRASVKGTGLGLSIASEYVEAHDGHIRVVASTAGAHFRVSIPIAGPRGLRKAPHARDGRGVLVGV
jgi:SAM-dependent methyltransferase